MLETREKIISSKIKIIYSSERGRNEVEEDSKPKMTGEAGFETVVVVVVIVDAVAVVVVVIGGAVVVVVVVGSSS